MRVVLESLQRILAFLGKAPTSESNENTHCYNSLRRQLLLCRLHRQSKWEPILRSMYRAGRSPPTPSPSKHLHYCQCVASYGKRVLALGSQVRGCVPILHFLP